jgi:peroxiredoxin
MNNNRFTDRMIGTVAPNLCLPSLDGPSLHGRVCLSDFAGRRHVVLYFMPRFTSSAAWRGAVALGRLQNALQKENTIVLLIGRGGYLRPATKLAAELDLPFTVLADEEWEAACRYGLDEEALPHPAVATFLVDEWGIVRHADIGAHPGALFDAPRLMREVRCLRTRAPLTKPVPWLYEPVELASCGR